MKTINHNFLSTIQYACIFCLSIFVFSSCEPDAVTGCTDPASTSYDILAVEDDGSCTYNSDRFLGSYVGPWACSTLSLSEETTITILDANAETKDSVALLFSNSIFDSLPGFGIITGDEMAFSAEAIGDSILYNGNKSKADVFLGGDLIISSGDSLLSGDVSLRILNDSGSTLVDADSCTYEGSK